MSYHNIAAMIIISMIIPATNPEKKLATITAGKVQFEDVSVDMSNRMQSFLVMLLRCVGQCLLSTICVLLTTREGLSSDISHARSMLMSVLAVSLPSGLE